MATRGQPVLEMHNILKVYRDSGVTATDHACLTVHPGQVHAVVGENGTGKSTLMKVLSGYTPADAGTIRVRGNSVTLRSPADALRLGVGMVHQHPSLVPELTVLDNVLLGTPAGSVHARRREARVHELRVIMEDYEIELELDRRGSALSTSEVIRASIASLLWKSIDVLILDEPGSTFTPKEHRWLHAAMRLMVSRGKTVILITHKLSSVFASADIVSVMRRGTIVLTSSVQETNERTVAHEMIGAPVVSTCSTQVTKGDGRTVMSLNRVSVRRTGGSALSDLSFQVQAGLITAVTGIRETGVDAVEELFAGGLTPDSGTITYNGVEVPMISPEWRRKRGVGYVPTDRLRQGSALDATVIENLIAVRRHEMQRCGLFDHQRIRRHSEALCRRFRINGKPGRPLRTLSGGNVQKTIIARELDAAKELLIFAEPFWGLDIRSQEMVVERLQSMANEDAAVLVIATDLDDVLRLADRVVVIHEGTVVMARDNLRLSRELLGDYMLGYRKD